jgi:hypothetical protein
MAECKILAIRVTRRHGAPALRILKTSKEFHTAEKRSK